MRELMYYLGKAEEAKDPFKSVYNDVLEHTSCIYEINDTAPIEPAFNRSIEPVVSTSIKSYINFLMGTLFQRGQEWGEIKINEVVYKNVNGLTVEALVDGKIRDINEQLELGTGIVFDYLNSSNFYLEITKVVTEATILGTGAYKFNPQTSVSMPFSFEHVPMDNFYFYEDTNGKPNYCFRKFYGFNANDIVFNFPGATVPKALTEDPIKTIDLIESVIPIDKGVFKRTIHTAGFTDELFNEELPYNPYVVCRTDIEPNGIWGIGLGVQALETFRDLRYYNQLRKDNAELLIKPPLKAMGDKALIHGAKYESGVINYGGSGSVDPKTGIANSFMLEPINTSLTMIPVDQEVLKLETEIKDIFISNPLGEITDYKSRTMYETEARLNLFRNRHAATFELFQSELLEPTLTLPFMHLVRTGIINFNLDDVEWFDLTQVSYINELSKSKDREMIQNLTGAIAATSQAIALAPSAGLVPAEVQKQMLDSYEISYETRYDDAKFKELEKQIEIATVLKMSGGADEQGTTQ